MRENVLLNRQKLFKYFFGHFRKYEDFESVMMTCTQDSELLSSTEPSSDVDKPTDSIMWYKASLEIPPFRLCAPSFDIEPQVWPRRGRDKMAQLEEFEAVSKNASRPRGRGRVGGAIRRVGRGVRVWVRKPNGMSRT